MYEVVHIQVHAPIFICIGYKLNNRVLCFANIVFLNIWIYSLIPYRMANLWAWYQQSLPGLYIVGLSCENSPFVLMGCSENDLQGPSKIKQNSQGEMNFKGYHDVVASSLAAPSVGGAVHPGCGDMFQHCNHDHEKPDVDERWHSTCYVTLLRKHTDVATFILFRFLHVLDHPEHQKRMEAPFHSQPMRQCLSTITNGHAQLGVPQLQWIVKKVSINV